MMMDVRFVCLLLVPLVTAGVLDHESQLPEHLQRMVRSREVEGWALATVHAVHRLGDQETGQSKRDLEAHASDASSADMYTLSLHLTSGERLRMSLERRSVDTAGGVVTRILKDGKRTVSPLAARHCFFTGNLQGQESYASLAMCGGRLRGSVTTDKRYYEVHTLPENSDKRSADDVMRVLVTWTGAAHAQEGLLSGDAMMRRQVLDAASDKVDVQEEDGIEIPEEEGNHTLARRAYRTVTIELADYLDEYYLNDLEKNLGMTDTKEITDLMLQKWTTVAERLSDKENAGWTIKLKLVNLELWSSNPVPLLTYLIAHVVYNSIGCLPASIGQNWYTVSDTDTLGTRMAKVCKGTKSLPYDQVTLHTGFPVNPRGLYGISWIRGICRSGWRCAAMRSSNAGYFTELHEFGHSLGLNHDGKMRSCDNDSSPNGFMGGNRYSLRKCYKPVLDDTFNDPKKRCVFREDSPDYVALFK